MDQDIGLDCCQMLPSGQMSFPTAHESRAVTFKAQHAIRGPQSLAPPTRDPTALIQPLGESDLGTFFRYLNGNLAENGTPEVGYFAPRPRGDSAFPPEKEQEYRAALGIPIGNKGWRRVWVARASDGTLAGHVDLWAHPMPFTEHRCLLGMGVHRNYRRRGLGGELLDHALSWAASIAFLEWIDLHVLASNQSAIRLYRRAGFTKVGEAADMFRVDGLSITDITMTRRIHRCVRP